MPSKAKTPTHLPPIDPSILFVSIPPLLIITVYFVRKWYLARRLRVHGIGKGAPGFQTNVKRIRITPEIKERLARGENVSPDEIAAASAKMDELEAKGELDGSTQGVKGKKGKKGNVGGLLARRGVDQEIQLHGDRNGLSGGTVHEEKKEESALVNEWLPENLTTPKKRPGKGKKK